MSPDGDASGSPGVSNSIAAEMSRDGDASGSPERSDRIAADMSFEGDGGDASGSPGLSDRTAAAQGAMPAPRDDSTTPQRGSVNDAGDNIDTASMPQPTTEITSRSREIAGGSSMTKAASDEPATSMPDPMRMRSSVFRRETSRSQEIAGGSSKGKAATASNEAATRMPGAESMRVRFSGLGRGFELGTVPLGLLDGADTEILDGADAVSDQIFDVWDDNVSQAFNEIRTEIQGNDNRWSLVGIDTEFCRMDGIVDPRVPPTSAEDHYRQACRIVDGGNLVQVGMAFGDSENSCRTVYQFNIQFNPSSRDSLSPNIDFLKNTAKLDLDAHYARGIKPFTFFVLLSESGLLKNTNVSWITYQGYSDFGYLIRGLENIVALPRDRRQFLLLIHKYFPRTADLKIFHMSGICCYAPVRGIRGSASFQNMASGLRVKRIGEAHGAGSDAHLTLLCYHTMVTSHPLAASMLSEYRNTVYGVDEAISRPPEDSELTYIEVSAANWSSQSKLISDVFQSNTCAAVGLAVDYELKSTPPVSYHAACGLIEGLRGPVKIGFATADHFGRICFGRIWVLNLQGTSKDPSHIRHDQLATVLTQASALFNHGIIWCSSSSFAHMCMLKALTTASCLPTSLHGSYQIHNGFFPGATVVPLRSTERREGQRSVATLRFFTYNQESALPAFCGFC